MKALLNFLKIERISYLILKEFLNLDRLSRFFCGGEKQIDRHLNLFTELPRDLKLFFVIRYSKLMPLGHPHHQGGYPGYASSSGFPPSNTAGSTSSITNHSYARLPVNFSNTPQPMVRMKAWSQFAVA